MSPESGRQSLPGTLSSAGRETDCLLSGNYGEPGNTNAELDYLTSVKGGANLTATELEAMPNLNTVIEHSRPSLPRMKIIVNKV